MQVIARPLAQVQAGIHGHVPASCKIVLEPPELCGGDALLQQVGVEI